MRCADLAVSESCHPQCRVQVPDIYAGSFATFGRIASCRISGDTRPADVSHADRNRCKLSGTAPTGESAMDLVYLNETQNKNFNREYHSRQEMGDKLSRLTAAELPEAARILDLGGGNGKFLDGLLCYFKSWRGTLLDVSPGLAAINVPMDRKQIVIGSVGDLDKLLPGQKFDVITVNWLLHHLIGSNYAACERNCVATLRACGAVLARNGYIVVSENMFDGFFETNIPSFVIYCITRIRAPWFVKISRRYFNTAGIGVCFRSRKSWRKIFREAGLDIAIEDQGRLWALTGKRGSMNRLLGIRAIYHRHFYLQSNRP
jgi:hypothetical protein